MANIIVATEEQIQEAVFNAVSKFFSGNQQAMFSSDLPDTLSMPNALKVLEDNGFPTSKAKLYKMTFARTNTFYEVWKQTCLFPQSSLLSGHTSNWFQAVMKIAIRQSAFRNVSNVNAKTMSTKEAFKNESPFVRVGTTLYKIVNQPRLNGGTYQETHRMEQRNTSSRLWQGLFSECSQIRRFLYRP